MKDATRILRATVTPSEPGGPLTEGPVFAAPFHVPGEVTQARYSYARFEQPNWTALEKLLAVIETGEGLPGGHEAQTLCFGSGMAATMAVFATVLRPGDALVLPTGGYFTSRVLAETYFAQMGVQVREAPVTDEPQDELLDGARLLWIETPSNPGMEVTDIARFSALAHTHGVLVACDNTVATPLGQNVLALGADFSVISDTKLMTGHSDLLMGHVAVTDRVRYEQLLRWRSLSGSGPGPMEAWLAARSLATLPLRHERSTSNAFAVADWLENRHDVVRVVYPGLESHPSHHTAVRQMRSFGPVVGFSLSSQAMAEVFLREAQLVTNATSFGGVTTTAERRGRWGHDAVEAGFIRMSVGCEDLNDLLQDFAQALEKAGACE